MRAEGVTVVAVAAFGLSFVAGMQASSGPVTPPKGPVAAAVKPLKLATADALPAIAAEPAKPEKKRKPKPKPKKPKPKKPKQKPRPKPVVRSPAPRVVRAPAPVVRAAPAPPPAAAPAPVATAPPRPASTPRPVRTPAPAPTFDDGGEPNSGEFENGGTP